MVVVYFAFGLQLCVEVFGDAVQEWCQIFLVHDFTLPDGEHVPAVGFQLEGVELVAALVGKDLVLPECGVAFGLCGVLAVGVAMPEAAVHEDDGFVLLEHDVGFARQFAMQAIAEAAGKEGLSEKDLRFGVLAANFRHHRGTFYGRKNIHRNLAGQR